MPPTRQTLRFNTLPGLARAFREWACTSEVRTLPEVDGASAEEQRLLGALGAVAAAVAGEHIADWPQGVRSWAEFAPRCPAEIVEGVRDALGRGFDPLATLYDASISRAHRRRLGTVFTPMPVVEHMLDIAHQQIDEPDLIADPGAGIGAFTVAAADRWPRAHIVAVDVNVVTLGLLATRIAFELDADPVQENPLRRIELRHEDYLDLLGNRFGAGEGRLLCLGNPPYTRIQELSAEYRVKAMGFSSGVVDSGHANLAVLFQAATLKHLKDRDASCMVLPGSIGYTRAARGLREALWNSQRPIVMHRTPAKTRPFTGSSVQATIVAAGPVEVERTPVRMGRVIFDDDEAKMIERWELARRSEEPSNWFWTQPNEKPEDTIALEQIAIVRRGVATGANDVFFLTDAQAAALPSEVLTAGVLTLRAFAQEKIDESLHRTWGGERTKRWLLAIPPDYRIEGELRAYLRRFEEDVSKRFLPSLRKPWYAISDLKRPDVLIGPLSNDDFKVVLNTVRAVPSNNLFGITMRNGTSPEVLAKWLRSENGQGALLRVSRRYHGGSHKLEPGDLKRVSIPATLISSRS